MRPLDLITHHIIKHFIKLYFLSPRMWCNWGPKFSHEQIQHHGHVALHRVQNTIKSGIVFTNIWTSDEITVLLFVLISDLNKMYDESILDLECSRFWESRNFYQAGTSHLTPEGDFYFYWLIGNIASREPHKL